MREDSLEKLYSGLLFFCYFETVFFWYLSGLPRDFSRTLVLQSLRFRLLADAFSAYFAMPPFPFLRQNLKTSSPAARRCQNQGVFVLERRGFPVSVPHTVRSCQEASSWRWSLRKDICLAKLYFSFCRESRSFVIQLYDLILASPLLT